MDNTESIFQIILYGGNARSSAMEAIQHAKEGNFAAAKEALNVAGKEFSQAHEIQTSLIQQEVAGNSVEVSLLMVHAQDHLMNAITVRDLAMELVELYEILPKVGNATTT